MHTITTTAYLIRFLLKSAADRELNDTKYIRAYFYLTDNKNNNHNLDTLILWKRILTFLQ